MVFIGRSSVYLSIVLLIGANAQDLIADVVQTEQCLWKLQGLGKPKRNIRYPMVFGPPPSRSKQHIVADVRTLS
jgi:hypothetical protein